MKRTKQLENSLDQNIVEAAEKRLMRKNPPMRLLGGVLDAIFTVTLAAIIAFSAGLPIANNVGMREASMNVTATLYLSGLYELNDNNSVVVIEDSADYPSALYYFYVDREASEGSGLVRGLSPLLDETKNYNTVEEYYDVILLRNQASSPFDFSLPIDEEKPWDVAVKDGQVAAAETLYQSNFELALDHLYQNESLVENTYTFYQMFFVAIALSFVVAAFLLVALLPLLTKDGVTLGKRFTATTIANKYGYRLTKAQALYRGSLAFILYYVLFLLPIGFVSLLMMAITKKEASLVDKIALTVVLDKKASVVYKNAEEEKIFNIQRAKNIVRLRKRQELGESEKNT